ncbi:MAG: ATP-binding protein [Firmicutes bacterium]|nr:ATP-binding protein [Bacillota bacterium]
MHKEISGLILYRDLPENSILLKMAGIFRDFEQGTSSAELIPRIYEQIKALLDISTKYGFSDNLWQSYLTFELLTNENSFTLTCEKTPAREGSVNEFAKNDFSIFQKLFAYDFTPIEKALNINCFSIISNYTALEKKETAYNKNVSEKVKILCAGLRKAKNTEIFFELITNFYRDFGVGMFGLNKAFRISESTDGVDFLPINNTDRALLSELVGYESQKAELRANTEAFINGGRANNVLLYGDAGTGKSTAIKALINEYYDSGLRMIEIYRHQFRLLSSVIAKIKNRNYRFIIYMDDLSFEEFETEYKFLKAVIEGGVESRPDNVLIYATSNRRHLIRETWSDRSDISKDELHRSDTIQEKLSLSDRFGISIGFFRPGREQYLDIVKELSQREGINITDELIEAAKIWELRHGGVSGRTARQFVDSLRA